MRRMPNGEYPPIHPLPADYDWNDDICPVCNTVSHGAAPRKTYQRMVEQEVTEEVSRTLEEHYQQRYGQ